MIFAISHNAVGHNLEGGKLHLGDQLSVAATRAQTTSLKEDSLAFLRTQKSIKCFVKHETWIGDPGPKSRGEPSCATTGVLTYCSLNPERQQNVGEERNREMVRSQKLR